MSVLVCCDQPGVSKDKERNRPQSTRLFVIAILGASFIGPPRSFTLPEGMHGVLHNLCSNLTGYSQKTTQSITYPGQTRILGSAPRRNIAQPPWQRLPLDFFSEAVIS